MIFSNMGVKIEKIVEMQRKKSRGVSKVLRVPLRGPLCAFERSFVRLGG